MPRTAALLAFLFALLVLTPPATALTPETLRVFLPADGRTYFESNLGASVDIDEPAETTTLVVRLDGVDVTSLFTTVNRRAKATLTALAPGPHTLEAQATGQVFDPLLSQFVTQTFMDASMFTVATPVSAADFINLGIDQLARRDLPAARDAFTQARAIQPLNQQASLLLALTRIAILLDPTLPGANPALLDSAGEFLDALGFPPQGRDLFDFTAMLPMDAMGHIMLPPTAPQGPEGQRFAVQDVLPQIVAALNNLRIIGKQFVYLFPADRLGEGFPPVEIDFADVQVLRGALFLAQASILAGNSYNLNFGAPDVLVQKANEGTFDVQQDVILANPDLLRLVSTTDLPTIKSAISGGINSILAGLTSMDGETDPQNNDLLFVPPDQKVNEAKAKQLLVALRKSLTRKTVIPDVRFDPTDPNDVDISTPVFLGALFSKNGIDIRSKLPQFQRRPDGKNVVLSRTFPDPTMGRLLPTFTQSEVIFLTDTIAPSIDVHATGFPDDPNMFHIMGSVVEEDLAAGLDLTSWKVELSLTFPQFVPTPEPFDPGTSHTFDVTDRFPLTKQPDGSATFDTFLRFVDPTAPEAVLTFKATDLNGNLRRTSLILDLFTAIVLDPSSAAGGIPITAGDGLAGHFVQVSNSLPCCDPADAATAEARAALQPGDPGVVGAVDKMIVSELDLDNYDNHRIPLPGPGAATLSGFLRVDAPGVLDFQVYDPYRSFTRLRIGGVSIIELSSSSSTIARRSVFFPVAGLYSFEVLFAYENSYEVLEISMAPGERSVGYDSPFIPRTLLYKTGDTDGDGVTDSVEIAAGLDPNNPGDLDTDADGDGLTGRQELALGTKANNPDTDGDTLNDGEELVPGADGFVTDPKLVDTEGDGRPDGTDPIPVFAQVDLSAASPVVRPNASAVTAQLRFRDGTPIQKAGVPFRLTVGGSAHFAASATEGSVNSGGGTSSVLVQTSANGRVVIDVTDLVAQTVIASFQDSSTVGIDGQLYFSDFETGPGGFTEVQGTAWELSTPTQGPMAAASGVNAWWTTPGYTSPIIESGAIRLPALTTIRMRFTHFLDIVGGCCQSGNVGLRFEPSGSPFTTASFSTPTTSYTTQNISLPFVSSDSFVHLRFSTSFGTRSAWFVDDVQVYLPGTNSTTVVFQ